MVESPLSVRSVKTRHHVMLFAFKMVKIWTLSTEKDDIILWIKDGYGNDTERKEKHIIYATFTVGSVSKREGHKKEITRKLGVCLATVYNELKRGEYTSNGTVRTIGANDITSPQRYGPNIAENKYRLNMSAYGAPLKLGNDYDFVCYVEKRICVDRISRLPFAAR